MSKTHWAQVNPADVEMIRNQAVRETEERIAEWLDDLRSTVSDADEAEDGIKRDDYAYLAEAIRSRSYLPEPQSEE